MSSSGSQAFSPKKPDYCNFDFERFSALFNALESLRREVPFLVTAERVDHLEPLIEASKNSNNQMGRLSEHDIDRMQDLGRCTHNRLLVLLLEPTKKSDETVECVDSFLRWASHGSLNRENTAIIDCRALVPNASYLERYTDNSAYV